MRAVVLCLLAVGIAFGQCKPQYDPLQEKIVCMPSTAAPTGTAGGSLNGTFPNPGVNGFTSSSTDPATCTPGATLDNWNTTASAFHYCSGTNTWSAGRSVIGNLAIGPTLLNGSGANITSTDQVTPANPGAGLTKVYTKAGKVCSLDPSGNENCTGASLTIPSVSNLLKGNGSGGVSDSKVSITAPTTVWTITPSADNQTTTLPTGTMVAGGDNLSVVGSIPYVSASGVLQKNSDFILSLAQSSFIISSSTPTHTSGTHNVGFGPAVFLNLTSGANNTAFGNSSLANVGNGHENTAFGEEAGGGITTGTFNTAVGYRTMFGTLTGTQNSALGYTALGANTSASNNTAVGYDALFHATTASANTALGSLALASITVNSSGILGQSNTAVGYLAGTSMTDGFENTCLGMNSCHDTTTAGVNTAVGLEALQNNTTGGENTAVGVDALRSTSTGIENVGVGDGAGAINGGVGTNANTTGSNNTFLGTFAAPGSTTQQNFMTVIGSNATGACNNCIVLGRAADVTLIIPTTTGNLPTCNSAAHGSLKPVTDSDTQTWGATVVHTSGTLPVLAYCDGTNWTVAAK